MREREKRVGLQQQNSRETVSVKNNLTDDCGLFGDRFPEFATFINAM
jgi:hypothetical protein